MSGSSLLATHSAQQIRCFLPTMNAAVAGEIQTGWPQSLQGTLEEPATGGRGIINTLKQRTTISSSSSDFSGLGFGRLCLLPRHPGLLVKYRSGWIGPSIRRVGPHDGGRCRGSRGVREAPGSYLPPGGRIRHKARRGSSGGSPPVRPSTVRSRDIGRARGISRGSRMSSDRPSPPSRRPAMNHQSSSRSALASSVSWGSLMNSHRPATRPGGVVPWP